MKKQKKSHYDKGLGWEKYYNTALKIFFWIFLIGFVAYKFKCIPEEWAPAFEKIEVAAFVAVISVKAKHFYHKKMFCPKCQKRLKIGSIIKKDACNWCDEL